MSTRKDVRNRQDGSKVRDMETPPRTETIRGYGPGERDRNSSPTYGMATWQGSFSRTGQGESAQHF